MNLTDKNGTILAHCHAGCEQTAVIDALRSRSLWNGSPTASSGPAHVVASYDYRAEDGALLYQVERLAPKSFRVRRPDGNGGWTYGLDGTRRLLYRLPDVVAVARQGWRVYVVEGERDADAIADDAPVGLGLCGTTAPFGAGKWRDEYADALHGAEVVVIADKDSPGRAHAQTVARSCKEMAKSVKVLELPGEQVKDASDWINMGGTRVELEALADAAPAWSPEAERVSDALGVRSASERNRLPFRTARELSEMTPARTDFLLDGYLARGAITELVGRVKASGKTTLALAWCRSIIDGQAFAGRAVKRGQVIYLTEQSDRTFREALRRAGLEHEERLTVLYWHEVRGIPWSVIVDKAIAECRRREAALLVVDTIGQWPGSEATARTTPARPARPWSPSKSPPRRTIWRSWSRATLARAATT